MSLLPGAEPFLFDAGAEAPAGVLLCHGFTGTPQSMRPWGEYLYEAGYTCACPRLPGHGTRWQDLNATRWEDWYSELERTFDLMLDRCEPAGVPVFAMGLSMGATLVTRLVEKRGDEIAGLVVVNPSLLTLRRDAPLLRLLAPVVGSIGAIGSDIKKPRETEQSYDRTPLRAAYSLSQLWRIVRADLAAVRLPVRLYRSAEDHVVEPVNSQVYLDGISSTDVEEVVLTNSYHVATLDYDAETIFAGSVEFLRERLLQLSEQDSPL